MVPKIGIATKYLDISMKEDLLVRVGSNLPIINCIQKPSIENTLSVHVLKIRFVVWSKPISVTPVYLEECLDESRIKNLESRLWTTLHDSSV